MRKTVMKKRILSAVLAAALVIGSFSAFSTEAKAETLRYTVSGQLKNVEYSKTPVGMHGTLSVKKVSQYKAPTIVDASGKPVLLRGVSTHGVQWFPQYVNEAGFQSMRDEWGINCVRLALYAREGGYTDGSQAAMDKKIKEGVDAAKKLGMYVILDWHVLSYNPNETKSQAKEFFKKYATTYKNCSNVIFEIANEPTGTPWYNGSGNDLYSYSKDVCKTIRATGANNIIICGTNDWSQRVDEVSTKPLSKDGINNVMYALHFYAATHYDGIKSNMTKAINAGTPVFVSEFGTCDASGNGGYDFNNANAWMKLMGDNNISYCNWSLCNKGESASILKSSTSKTSKWTANDLTESGKWLINVSRDFAAKEGTSASNTGSTTKPSTGNTGSNTGSTTKPSTGNTGSNTGSTTKPSTGNTGSNTGSTTKPSTGNTGSSTTTAGKTAKVAVQSQWNGGCVVNGTVSSTKQLNGWTVEFDFDGQITSIWCAKIKSHSGKHYVIVNESYNAKVTPSQPATFGFTATTKTTPKFTNVK